MAVDPESAGEVGLSSAYLSQVSVREAVQILLEPTDMNRVLVPVGIEVRMVRPAQSTDAWAAPKGTTIIIRTRQGSCCCYAQGWGQLPYPKDHVFFTPGVSPQLRVGLSPYSVHVMQRE